MTYLFKYLVGVVLQVLLLLVDVPLVQVADPVLLQDLQHHLGLVLRVDVPESDVQEPKGLLGIGLYGRLRCSQLAVMYRIVSVSSKLKAWRPILFSFFSERFALRSLGLWPVVTPRMGCINLNLA